MNRKYYTAFAVSAVAMGAVAFTATEASATMNDPQPRPSAASEWPDEGSGYPVAGNPSAASGWPDEASGYPRSQNPTPEYNYPNFDPKFELAPTKAAPVTTTAKSSSDGNGVEFLQSGASALGGAAVALSAVWLYRRRQLPTA